jgi:hypothetical protein
MTCRCGPRLKALGIRSVDEADEVIGILRDLIRAGAGASGACIFCESEHDFDGFKPLEKHLAECPYARLVRWLDVRKLLQA